MKLFFDINIKNNFGKKTKYFLREILGAINQMSEKTQSLAEQVTTLEKSVTDANVRKDARIAQLQELLDTATATNAQTDADLSPLVDRISALITAENAQSPTTTETPAPPVTETPAETTPPTASTLPADNATAASTPPADNVTAA